MFYFTHLLYFAYFSILVLHAKTPWHWIIAPVIVFACGLLYRLFSMFTENRGRSVVTSGIVLPSNVTGLIIKRPHNFNFSPGDWVFIKVREVNDSIGISFDLLQTVLRSPRLQCSSGTRSPSAPRRRKRTSSPFTFVVSGVGPRSSTVTLSRSTGRTD